MAATHGTTQTERTQVRCMVVDDHAAVREGVKMILARDREITVIGESGAAPERSRWPVGAAPMWW